MKPTELIIRKALTVIRRFFKWVIILIAGVALFIIIVLAFDLRRIGSKNIENHPTEKVRFSNLPFKVRETYIKEFEKDDSGISCIAISSDKSCKVKAYTIENHWQLLTHGFIYEFYYDGDVYSLQANQGDPFVFYESHFYYPDKLNPTLGSNNFKSIKYNKVKISN